MMPRIIPAISLTGGAMSAKSMSPIFNWSVTCHQRNYVRGYSLLRVFTYGNTYGSR